LAATLAMIAVSTCRFKFLRKTSDGFTCAGVTAAALFNLFKGFFTADRGSLGPGVDFFILSGVTLVRVTRELFFFIPDTLVFGVTFSELGVVATVGVTDFNLGDGSTVRSFLLESIGVVSSGRFVPRVSSIGFEFSFSDFLVVFFSIVCLASSFIFSSVFFVSTAVSLTVEVCELTETFNFETLPFAIFGVFNDFGVGTVLFVAALVCRVSFLGLPIFADLGVWTFFSTGGIIVPDTDFFVSGLFRGVVTASAGFAFFSKLFLVFALFSWLLETRVCTTHLTLSLLVCSSSSRLKMTFGSSLIL